jgi:hypothetical protein
MLKRVLFRSATVFATMAVTAVFVAPPSANALATGAAVWRAMNKAGGTTCVQVAATTVRCQHDYHSTQIDPLSGDSQQTCSAAGINPQPATVDVSSCDATLTGYTSGPGKLVTTSGAVCDTLSTGTVTFHIDTLIGSYSMAADLKVENNEVVSHVTGEEVTPDGLFVQHVNAYFTGGCGVQTSGAFWGTWSIVRVVQ